jgi:sporulation protein YlmC with PRC-barrel domain
MKKLVLYTILVTGLIGAGGITGAAEGESAEMTPRDALQAEKPAAIEYSQLKGKVIRNRQGERLGRITDVIFEEGTGNIGYVVVSYEDSLGLKGMQCLVPWNALKVGQRDQAVTLDMGAEKFKKAPKKAEAAGPEFDEEVHDFYGVAPHWQGEVGSTQELLEEDKQ